MEKNLLSILCFCILYIGNAEYVLKKVEVPSNGKGVKFFSDDDIAQYDGSDTSLPIYMGVKGVVFDVTSGKGFYGKDAAYNVLVGKDSSRAVAKMSLDPSDLNSDMTGLKDSTLKDLDETFEGTYMAKYPVVGYMDYLREEAERGQGVKDDL